MPSPLAILRQIKEKNLIQTGEGDDLKLDDFKDKMEEARAACGENDDPKFRERLLGLIDKIGRWTISICRQRSKDSQAIGILAEALEAYFERQEGMRTVLGVIVAIVGIGGTIFGILAVTGVFK